MARSKTKSTLKSRKKAARPAPRRTEATSSHPAIPPKLTPPRPAKLLLRERLFNLLDKLRTDHRVIWVSAPGGAGKTSLAASYLAERKAPTLWYQVDASDGDIASFFYYLGLAVRHASPRHKQPLPLLTPEYLMDVPTFARNFFREFYRRLKTGAVLVLDNYQDAPEASMLHDVLQIAMSEVPEDKNLIVLSRLEPPATLARLRLCEHAACLDWDKLRLTPEETEGLSTLRAGRLDEKTLDTLKARTHGWAAGVVLMLEQARSGASLDTATTTADQKLLFDYFAGEVLHRSPPEVREFLLKTAYFPRFTLTMATEVTGNQNAELVLDDLTRRNYFTVRHADNPPSYEYHPLFREFLTSRIVQEWPEAQRSAQMQACARSLLAAGNPVAGVDLLLQAGAESQAVGEILGLAPKLIMQGYAQTLAGWINQLSVEQRVQAPWINYWLALCMIGFNPPQALVLFASAYRQFVLANDIQGIYRTWSGAVDAIWFSQQDQFQLDFWIAEFEKLEADGSSIPSVDIEAQVYSSLLRAACWRQPGHPAIERWARHARDLFNGSNSSAGRIKLGMDLLFFTVFFHGARAALDLTDEIEKLEQSESVDPVTHILAKPLSAFTLFFEGQVEAALARASAALSQADETGIHVFDQLTMGAGVYCLLTLGDLNMAEAWLNRMNRQMAGRPETLDTAFHQTLAAWLELRKNDLAKAEHCARRAIDIALRVGSVYPEAHSRIGLAHVLFARGRFEEAFAELQLVSQHGAVPLMTFNSRFIEAACLYQQGREIEAVESLRVSLSIASNLGYGQPIYWQPGLISRIAALALNHHIEPDYVRSMIRRRGLTPPPDQPIPETWPFPVKVYTLGRFRVLLDEAPLTFSTKTQKKPLELLKALIALGGKGVPVMQLAEALWPEAEGDHAQRSLFTTLHRLRKLLQSEDAIRIDGGNLTLDPRHVWVDLWTLERSLGLLDADTPKDANSLTPVLERIARLHSGSLFNDESSPWALSARERLRHRALRTLERLGRTLESAHQYELALETYRTVLDFDPVAESLYRQCMQAELALGRRAEALSTYDRCRTALKTRLNLEPSPETEAVRERARQ